jgi:RNA 3'-terminal phosphate cyclase (ATP)
MSEFITIDGSQGEGGGQILRSSLALSMLSGQPFRIEKIRANRDKPGLMRQHLTAVNAAAAICGAQLDGAAIGSRQLTFLPGPVKAGDYTFATGSAGSTTLVLQTVLPPLLLAEAPSALTLEGGTHNIHAPPLDFLQKAFVPVLNQMGPRVELALERAGFYPAGGGRVFATITPAAKLSPIMIGKRGQITRQLARALCAGLPGEIAVRELEVIGKGLKWPPELLQIRQLPPDQGPGNIVMIEIESACGTTTGAPGPPQDHSSTMTAAAPLPPQYICEVFTGFGQRGVRAEAVADDALQQAKRYLAAGAPVGQCLADQLILPFALAGGGSYVTMEPTLHTTTNIEVVQKFLPTKVTCEQVSGEQWKVSFA